MVSKWDIPGVASGVDQYWVEAPSEHLFREAVVEWIGPGVGNAKLLDVACGSARYAPLLKGYRYFGVDGSKEMLALARERVPEDSLQLCDLLKGLPFPDASFNTVLCIQMLRHMSSFADVIAVTAELFRVAKRRVFIVDAFQNGGDHLYSTTERAGVTFHDNSWSMPLFLDYVKENHPTWQAETKQLLDWVCGVSAINAS